MLTRVYPAFIAILLVLVAFQYGQVRSLQRSLTETAKTLGECSVGLEESIAEIDLQNAEVAALREKLDDSVAEKTTEVITIYRDLPAQIKRDHAAPPADINQWMQGLFQ